MESKQELRARLRRARKAHVAGLPESTRALVLMRPPGPLAARVGVAATVGLYHPVGDEAPTLRYARWFHENGRKLALPWFADGDAAMEFRGWVDPWEDEALAAGPHRALQAVGGTEVVPDLVIVPLLGFTADGHRLGQGGGHYDRWLAQHPDVCAIGLAWDCQLLDDLQIEAHDRRLDAVVTPTRLYGDLG